MTKKYCKNIFKTGLNSRSFALASILTFAVVFSLFAPPTTFAHTPPLTISTYAYLNVAPNPVGIGQTAYLNFWLDKVPPTSHGSYGNMWHNMTVTMTKPDGTTEILGPLNSDAAGGTWTQFVADQVGTYKFVGHFPGQTIVVENPNPFAPMNPDSINDTYTGSTSNEVKLTVQDEQVTTAYPDNSLPTNYWTRPINSMNRNWYTIGGNWLGLGQNTFARTGLYNYNNGNFNPYTEAPNSAHVLWTKALAFGGQIGGEFGSDDTSLFATGTAYEPKFAPVIMYGILYYTSYPGAATNPGPLTAVDLHTGQTLWTINASAPLRTGMMYNFKTGNQYGAHAYLFTGWQGIPMSGFTIPLDGSIDFTKWSMYDAMTGQWILDIANVTAGTLVEGQNGEILSYNTNANGKLTLWNSSLCIAQGSKSSAIYPAYDASEIWRPTQGATIDWNLGNQWTVPIGLTASFNTWPAANRVSDNVVLLTESAPQVPGRASSGWQLEAGYSAVDGHLLWGPINQTLTPWTNVALGPAAEGVYTEYTSQTMKWTGYDIKTGEKLWETSPTNSSWGYYGCSGIIGYGNLYTYTIAGEVYCYDLKTGTEKWSWVVGNAGYDTPYGTYPFWTVDMVGAGVVADGKLYVASSHDYTPPVYKGAKLYCINATSGEQLWNTLDFGGTQDNGRPIADGILVSYNCYDNQIYAFGKGASAITVTAPAVGVTTATPITISGTITDISDGNQQDAIAKNFPNGLPCISDASQSAFMEAVYQQQGMPTNLTGVPVTINVVDSNGNYRSIGTAVSNAYGTYSLTWTPDISGDYTVIANFAGTNSYYPSSTAAAFYASEVVATPGPTQPPVQSMADTYLLPSVAAIIIAIAVVGAVLGIACH